MPGRVPDASFIQPRVALFRTENAHKSRPAFIFLPRRVSLVWIRVDTTEKLFPREGWRDRNVRGPGHCLRRVYVRATDYKPSSRLYSQFFFFRFFLSFLFLFLISRIPPAQGGISIAMSSRAYCGTCARGDNCGIRWEERPITGIRITAGFRHTFVRTAVGI